MPLTEQELQAFEEMARQWADGESLRSRRRLVGAGFGLVLGLVVVVAGFTASVWIAMGGYLVMVACSLVAVRASRQLPAPAWASAAATRLHRSSSS